MIVIRENERLYLKSWEYNAARVITELANIVTTAGGRVRSTRNAIISNRSIDDAMRNYVAKIDYLLELEKESHNERKTFAIKTYSEKLAKLGEIDNSPILVTHTNYISFVYDGFYFYYEVNDNPFFNFFYTKTPVTNGLYSRDTCSKRDEKEWLSDCFFFTMCSNSDVKKAAKFIFNMLVDAKPSIIYRDRKKQRVSNLYDGGYHYGMIYSPERFAKIDF